MPARGRCVSGRHSGGYRCQATEALRASERMSNWDLAAVCPRAEGRERRPAAAAPGERARRRGRARARPAPARDPPPDPGPRRTPVAERAGAGAERPAQPKLDLRPGDTVEVRSREEIVATLDARGKTRGLWFDPEMVPYCGRQYRVQERVEQIIDERTGEMIRIPSDCLILKGVVCSGDHSPGRWLCPREIYPYWREAWLRRVEDG